MSLTVYDETRPAWFSVVLLPIAEQVPVDLAGFVTERRRIDSLVVATTSTTDVELVVMLMKGQYLLLGTYTVPAGAGYSGAVPVYDLLAAMRVSGIAEVVLEADDTLQFYTQDDLVNPDTVTISGLGGLLT